MKELIKDLDLLRTPAEPLTFITPTGTDTAEGEAIIKDLKELMEADKTILCLAAPQIGVNKRIFCIRFNETIKTFINPIVTKKSGGTVSPETFLGMPNKEILIARPEEITTVYYNDEFKYEDNKLIGPAAKVFDQMTNLLDGVLPDELGLISDIEIDGPLADCTEDEIPQLLEIYKQFVQAKSQFLADEMNKDEETAKHFKLLKFTEDVVNGRTQVIENNPPKKQTAKQVKAENKNKLNRFLSRKK